MSETKSLICIKCKVGKTNNHFSKRHNSKSGYSTICKTCESLYQKKHYSNDDQKKKRQEYGKSYYQRNKEIVLQKVKEYREKPEIKDKRSKRIKQDSLLNPGKYLWKHAKRRAKEKNLPFSIKIEDIIVPEYCPVLGIKLIQGEGKVHDGSPTLDKVIPELGYIPGNVVVMSKRANTLKSNGTLEEHKQLVKWMEERNK